MTGIFAAPDTTNLILPSDPPATMDSDKCVVCHEPITGADAEYVLVYVPSPLPTEMAARRYEGHLSGFTIINDKPYFTAAHSFRRHFLKH